MPIGRVCSGCGSRGKGFSLHYLRRLRKSDERLDERSDLFGVSSIVELAHLVLDLERCLLPLLVLLLAQSADHDAPQREGERREREVEELLARQKRYSYMTPSAEYQYSPVRRRMSAASAPLAGSSTTSALLSASLLRPTAATALDSLHRQRTLLSSPSSIIMLLSLCDGRPYTLKLAKAAETGGETDTTQPQIRFVRLTLSGFPSRIWMRLLRSLLTVEYTHLITTSRLLKLIMIILSTHSN